MRKSGFVIAVLSACLMAQAQPLAAEVSTVSDTAFVITLSADVPASKDEVWKALVSPSKWWSAEHTYSGDAANLYLDSQATGCFCEKLPKPADAPADQRMGSVEHMHIVYADPQRGVLRMKGGLGPLQGEPVDGVWTIMLKPTASGGTRIEWEYAVGGLLRLKGGEIAPMVNTVMGQQLTRLAALFNAAEEPSVESIAN